MKGRSWSNLTTIRKTEGTQVEAEVMVAVEINQETIYTLAKLEMTVDMRGAGCVIRRQFCV